jgi:hypothetical protein
MNAKEEIYEVWAPRDGLWSPWVKPVLFACMDGPINTALVSMDWDASGMPSAEENTILVLDLPGVEGVAAGLALAARGYRPVPLYNAVPMPILAPGPELGSGVALVDVRPILGALLRGTESLRKLSLRPDAPPAFLLDARRRGDGHSFPGAFDNRSVSFTTDFPSANFLLARGIHRAVLVQPTGDQPQADLAHTLLRWQEACMSIELKRLDVAGPPVPCEVVTPPRFRWLWQRALATFGLHRSPIGGFGDWVPEPTSAGG